MDDAAAWDDPWAGVASPASAAAPSMRLPLDLSTLRGGIPDAGDDLLLSQRALDFLAEVPSLPGTNPGTPRAAVASTASGGLSQRSPNSLSPLAAILPRFKCGTITPPGGSTGGKSK